MSVIVGGTGGGSSVRTLLTTDTTFYCSPTGSDSTGTGTFANPWFSAQPFWNLLSGGNGNLNNLPDPSSAPAGVDLNGFTAKCQFANGTYNIPFNMMYAGADTIGSGIIVFQGDPGGDPTKVIFQGSGADAVFNFSCQNLSAQVLIDAFTVNNFHNYVFSAAQGQIFVRDTVVNNCANTYEALGNGVVINVGGVETIGGTFNSHLFPHFGGSIGHAVASQTFVGTVNYAFAFIRMRDNGSSCYYSPASSITNIGGVVGTQISAFARCVLQYQASDPLARLPGNGAPVLEAGAAITAYPVTGGGTFDGPWFTYLGSRDVLSANRTYYLSPTGSDTTGDGSSAHPWFSPAKFWNFLVGGNWNTFASGQSFASPGLDVNGFVVTLQWMDGSYTYVSGQSLVIGAGWIGGGEIILQGNLADPTKVSITMSPTFILDFITVLGSLPGQMIVQNFTCNGFHDFLRMANKGQVFCQNNILGPSGIRPYEALFQNASITVQGTESVAGASFVSHMFVDVGGNITYTPSSANYTGAAYSTGFLQLNDPDSWIKFIPPATITGTATGAQANWGAGSAIQYEDVDYFAKVPGNSPPVIGGGARLFWFPPSGGSDRNGPYREVALRTYNYQQPTTGFSITMISGDDILILDPAGTLATGTIVTPAVGFDGQIIKIKSSQTVTALTISPNSGQSVAGVPTTIGAGITVEGVYRSANTTWYF